MTGITKGPWLYNEDSMWIEDAKGNQIIYGGRDGDLIGNIEDITLAVIAPELLEALKDSAIMLDRLKRQLRIIENAGYTQDGRMLSLSDVEAATSAAIDKAEGRA